MLQTSQDTTIVSVQLNTVESCICHCHTCCMPEQVQHVRRLEDVRATEIDKVQIANCFRPGDIIKAEVVSLGTSRDYYLSTAQNHLGVVYAKSLAGIARDLRWCIVVFTQIVFG